MLEGQRGLNSTYNRPQQKGTRFVAVLLCELNVSDV